MPLILPLHDGHDRTDFDCGEDHLNRWLAQTARQHKDRGVSATFVAVAEASSAQVLGFYAISLAELVSADLPASHRKRLPARVPAFRLGRLAVDRRHQGRQIGAFMLFDAIDRVARVSKEVGGVGLIVNAKPHAAAFYAQYGFEPMADHPHNLFLSI